MLSIETYCLVTGLRCHFISVNKIKQETDVMINIPDVAQGIATIRIEGSKEGVDKARAVRLGSWAFPSLTL